MTKPTYKELAEKVKSLETQVNECMAKLAEAAKEQEILVTQLEESQKMEAIGTLAGGIAHDFNNILAAIIGYSEMILDIVAPGKNESAMIQKVLKAGYRAADLTQQILTFSRPGTGERKPLQIHRVVKEALNLLLATIPTNIRIWQDLDPRCGSVMADPTQIHQVIMNLCTNSYHAMSKEGGTLGVTLHRVDFAPAGVFKNSTIPDTPAEAYIRLQISDSGHGMDEETLERVFNPYFTTKKKGEGTGLGLSVVDGIIKRHNGAITVKSEPDQGTVFQVYLPCIPQADTAPDKAPDEPLPMGNENILLVDDEAPLVEVGRMVLGKLGYRVTGVNGSLQALETFKAQPHAFDLVVTDMAMPDMTGAQLARKMMDIKPGLPIILCTGFSEIMNEESAKQFGFRGYVMKPVQIGEIAKIIRRVMDGDENNP
ncbi:MAG: response regulator [bacterium]|nr:response regulator [bacterium]